MGDALGYPVEFMKREEIVKQFGDNGICKYVLNGKGLAEISDDTQMTLFTATGILIGITREKLRAIMKQREGSVENPVNDSKGCGGIRSGRIDTWS